MEPTPRPEIVLQHGRFVHAFALALLRDAHLAEDVAQEVWTHWAEKRPSVTRPRGWLRQAVRHVAANAGRARARRARHELLAARPEGASAPDEEAAQAELLHRVVDAVYALDEPYRGTILARYFRGLAARALAEHEGVPVATVRSREQRALARLRERLDRESGGRRTWAGLLAGVAGRGTLVPGRTRAGTLAWKVACGALAVGGLWYAVSERSTPRGLHAPLPVSGAPAARADPVLVSAADAPAREVVAMLASTEMAAAKRGAEEDEVGEYVLRGVTVDPQGRALAGVALRFPREGFTAVEALSDERGRFAVTGLSLLREVEATLPGYRLLAATDPERDEDPTGPWAAMRVVLAPSTSVDVTVRDEDGRGLPDVDVAVWPAEEELADTHEGLRTLGRGGRGDGSTDASGRVALERVWTGVKLEVGIWLSSSDEPWKRLRFTTRRAAEGRLVFDARATGAPIVALPGRPLELEAVARDVRLPVRFVDEEGDPVRRARLMLYDLGHESRDDGYAVVSHLVVPLDRTELTFRTADLRGPLRIDASHGTGRRVDTATAPARTGELRIELEELAAHEERVVVLRESSVRRMVSLRILGASGAPLDEGVMLVQARQRGADVPLSSASSEGEPIVLSGLGPELFDLVVALDPAVAPAASRFQLFRDLPVGPEVLELRLTDECAVRARLRARGMEAAALTVSVLARFPKDASLAPAARAPRTQRARAGAWPTGFVANATNARNVWLRATAPAGARAVDVPVGIPGTYAFALLARDAAGRVLARAATPYADYVPGEYVIDFELVPCGSVRGRVVGDGTREFLAIALVDADGRELPLVGAADTAPAPMRALPTSARFFLRQVPAGTWRLRAGSVAELEAGRFGSETTLEVRAAETTAATLEL